MPSHLERMKTVRGGRICRSGKAARIMHSAALPPQRVLIKRRKSMYAIIEAGGKQFKVTTGDVLKVEKLEEEVGAKVTYEALFVSGDNGEIKTLDNAKKVKVTAEVVSQGKHPKIVVFKYRPKKRTKSKNGHRQPYTEIKIVEIK